MKFQATAKYLRISTRKVRLVADSIRRMPAEVARQQLERMPRRAAKMISGVLASAMANAKTANAGSQLMIDEIEVMGGPAMKRWRAVARGSAHGYKKRMTHIRIVLSDDTYPEADAKRKEEVKPA
ncbi:hypothetical protein A2Z33_06930 [Candidatus Gottesmanbacteria bacterium RBG_16_52_11]|uniref:Large ribosomal subunit protein uL22 n=1 Tax=Candidatus Gottesmanbacteria bacterium RBG_16_52_11 TaxID=1798374 RepID=A0A1F5YXY2_9BACT|nr:MAG: hypothetical protein A2Z33_06930 [Candidatus Gottesmanbacteria bacterium RBG_16_52_11]